MIPIPASTEPRIVVPTELSESSSLPTTLTIEGEVYTLALESPRSGEFIVNPQTGELLIHLIEVPETATVAVVQQTEALQTDFLSGPYPDIFYQLPMTGSFSWTVSLDGHPSGSFNFDTYPHLRSRVIELLCEGAEFIAFGIGFRVSSLSFTEKSAAPNTLTVAVGLGGRHENYDFNVPYQGTSIITVANPASAEPDPYCLGRLPSGAAAQSTKSYTSVQELARRVGDNFFGPYMKVPYEKDNTDGTNFITEAQNQVRMFGGFLYYSNPAGVQVRALAGTGVHHLNSTQIKSDIQVSVAGRRRKILNVGGTFLHPPLEFVDPYASTPPSVALEVKSENTNIYPWVKSYDPPYKLEGAFNEVAETNEEDTQANSEYQKPKWKARVPIRKVIVTPPENPAIPPAGTGPLKDVSLTFDNSGTQPKNQKTEITEDDMPVETREVSYGFAFLGSDMVSDDEIVGASPGCWQKIRETRTIHHYDVSTSGPSRNTGYYLGSDTTGSMLTRYLTEGSDLETTKLDSTDEIEGELLTCYNYFTIPIVGAERYYLESKRDYYNDIPASAVIYYKVCLPDGTSQYAFVEDPTWVDDFFVTTKENRENSFSARVHPENNPDDDDIRPPLTVGKETYHKEWITVLPSDKTRNNLKIPSAPLPATSDQKQTPQDAFLTSTVNYSSQDSQFTNSLAMATSDKSYGRPPTHTRKPPLLEKVEPESANGSAAKKASNNAMEYFVRSRLNPDARTTQGGTLSYPAATTLQQALTAAQTDLTLSNITGGTKESFEIEFNLSMQEGDCLIYSVDNIVRSRRLLSITREVRIDSRRNSPMLLGKNCSVSVGIERSTPMSSYSQRAPVPATTDENKKPQELNRLFIPDRWPLGEILNPDLPSRRNFSV